jgi:hypothetical protein
MKYIYIIDIMFYLLHKKLEVLIIIQFFINIYNMFQKRKNYIIYIFYFILIF